MKKIIILIFVILLGNNVFSQKAKFCKELESIMQITYPGIEINYSSNCLIITYPLILIANEANLERESLRNMSNVTGMNTFAKGYINEVYKQRFVFIDEGFYYIQIKFRDDKRHYYKIYSSSKLKIKHYY